MQDSNDLTAVIAGLFPPGVACCFSTRIPANADLLPEEARATSGMVDKRLDEFRHGRSCARMAMTKLGYAPAAIIKGADRAPVWPDGLCGSITHSGSAAGAVVARHTDYRSIGLDIETQEPLTPDLISMICRPGENPASDGTHAKRLFSIKEAIYKCLYPVVHSFIDFQEMEVEFTSARDFMAISYSAKCPQAVAAQLRGRYTTEAGYVISAAWLS